MKTIAINLVTFNRPEALNYSLKCFERAKYPGLKLNIINNGSGLSTTNILNKYKNRLNCSIINIQNNKDIKSLITEISLNTNADLIAPFVADDDFFHEKSLTYIDQAFSNRDINVLTGGYIKYNLAERKVDKRWKVSDLDSFQFPVMYKAGKEAVNEFCSYWGIGIRQNVPLWQAHSSTTFVRKKIIEKTIRKQGSILLGKFGDVGLLGMLYQTDYVAFLPNLVAVVCQSRNSDSKHESSKADRTFAHVDPSSCEYSPLKQASFINIGLDSHLEVLTKNEHYNSKTHQIRLDFFVHHIQQLLCSKPDFKLPRDILDSLKYVKQVFGEKALYSIIDLNFPNIKMQTEVINEELKLCGNNQRAKNLTFITQKNIQDLDYILSARI